MADHSAIEWTDATWNPTTGCTKISPECAHCYIERTPPFRTKGRKFVKGHIPLELHRERLATPHGWKNPRMVFVDSLSDLFHEDIPFEFIADVFTTMAQTTQHTYQVLTKRPERLLAFYRWNYQLGRPGGMRPADAKRDWLGSWPNVWFGVSAGNKRMWRQRVPTLLQVPAAVHWVSIEPILEDLVDELFTICLVSGWDAPPYDDKIDWVVVGGESGPGARPCHLAHVRRIVEACRRYQTPVFVKQLGAKPFGLCTPECGIGPHGMTFRNRKGGDPSEWPEDLRVREFPIGVASSPSPLAASDPHAPDPGTPGTRA